MDEVKDLKVNDILIDNYDSYFIIKNIFIKGECVFPHYKAIENCVVCCCIYRNGTLYSGLGSYMFYEKQFKDKQIFKATPEQTSYINKIMVFK